MTVINQLAVPFITSKSSLTFISSKVGQNPVPLTIPRISSADNEW